MSNTIGNLFTFQDRLQMESLNQRLQRDHILSSNIANAETPGYRALGYDFEEQLQGVGEMNEAFPMKSSHPAHSKHASALADGEILADIFVRPKESIGEDGNTVDLDQEMGESAKNQILYAAATETINRKIGLLRYAIQGG